MNKLASLVAFSALTACGDNTELPEPIAFPRTCAEAAIADASNGEHTLYVDGDETKPWTAYCADMQTKQPLEYLTLPEDGVGNLSMYRAGGQSPGTDVVTTYSKVRIDPMTLAIDTGDQRFASSRGSLVHLGATHVTSMPFGVGMACGPDYSFAQVDVRETPFVIAEDMFEVGAGRGGSNLWENLQVIELMAEGDCAWIAGVESPEFPINATGFALTLAYKK